MIKVPGNRAVTPTIIQAMLFRSKASFPFIRLVHFCLAGVLLLCLAACNTTGQPDYAQAYQDDIRKATVEVRIVKFSPTHRDDSGLEVSMLSVSDDGSLLLRSLFGISQLKKGQRTLLNGQYVLLLESNPDSQIARLKTWPKTVFQ